MTVNHPGATVAVRTSRGYPATLTGMLAEQRRADLIRSAELARTAQHAQVRQTRGEAPRPASRVVGAVGALAATAGVVRLTLARAVSHRAARGSRSQAACCA
jgi:hypothetical protein